MQPVTFFNTRNDKKNRPLDTYSKHNILTIQTVDGNFLEFLLFIRMIIANNEKIYNDQAIHATCVQVYSFKSQRSHGDSNNEI